MIQDIEPHHLDNQYKPVPPDKDSIALYYEDHAALMGFGTFEQGDLQRVYIFIFGR